MIPLVRDTIDNKDIDRLIEWLKKADFWGITFRPHTARCESAHTSLCIANRLNSVLFMWTNGGNGIADQLRKRPLQRE